MASDASFDVVSEFDHQEMVNAVDQTAREIGTRFDLKDTKSEIVLEKEKISLNAPSEMQLTAIKDILESKMVRRNLSLKILDFGKVEDAAGGRVRQVVTLQKGLDQDRAKEITKLIRDRFPKVKTAIQGDAVRVTGKSRDELQGVISVLRERDFPLPLQFTNYR